MIEWRAGCAERCLSGSGRRDGEIVRLRPVSYSTYARIPGASRMLQQDHESICNVGVPVQFGWFPSLPAVRAVNLGDSDR